jgi:hypothetical protein
MQPTKEYFQFVLKRTDSQLVFTTGVHNTWPELMDAFVNFLRGAGYSIEPGQYVTDYVLVPSEKLEALENAFFDDNVPQDFKD